MCSPYGLPVGFDDYEPDAAVGELSRDLLANPTESDENVVVGETLYLSLHALNPQYCGQFTLQDELEDGKQSVEDSANPADGEEYTNLRTALEKLQLNDASLNLEPENSVALGFGFRCGFLGLMHLEILQERLEREYDLDIIATAPSVGYQVVSTAGTTIHA